MPKKPQINRNRKIPKKSTYFEQRTVRKRLAATQRKSYPRSKYWWRNMGRRLHDYTRVHSFLLSNVGARELRGKKFVHLGSGNTNYCDYLARKYGVKAFAVDNELSFLKQAKANGSKALRVYNSAQKLRIKPNSVDIFLSDMFLFSDFPELIMGAHSEIIKKIGQGLRPGGLAIIERCIFDDRTKKFIQENGLKLIYREGISKLIQSHNPDYDLIVLTKEKA